MQHNNNFNNTKSSQIPPQITITQPPKIDKKKFSAQKPQSQLCSPQLLPVQGGSVAPLLTPALGPSQNFLQVPGVESLQRITLALAGVQEPPMFSLPASRVSLGNRNCPSQSMPMNSAVHSNSSQKPTSSRDLVMMASSKQLLWINKLIKLPVNGEIQTVEQVNSLLSETICKLSSEFMSHRHELAVTLEPCSFGPSHRKCRGIYLIKVQLKNVPAAEDSRQNLTNVAEIGNTPLLVNCSASAQSGMAFGSQSPESMVMIKKTTSLPQHQQDDEFFHASGPSTAGWSSNYLSANSSSAQLRRPSFFGQSDVEMQCDADGQVIEEESEGEQSENNCQFEQQHDSDEESKCGNEDHESSSSLQDLESGQMSDTCSQDPTRFELVNILAEQIVSRMLPDRVFKCDYIGCGKTFKLKQHLKHHELSHQNVNRFSCCFQGCAKSFSRASRLDLHIKSAHSGHNLFECQVPGCGKIFAEKGNLLVHMRTHTGEKPYPCRHCSKRFTTIGNCKDHERRHTNDKPYACRLCTVRYYRKYQLVKHITSKHPDAQPSDAQEIMSQRGDDEDYDETKQANAVDSEESYDSEKNCDHVMETSEQRVSSDDDFEEDDEEYGQKQKSSMRKRKSRLSVSGKSAMLPVEEEPDMKRLKSSQSSLSVSATSQNAKMPANRKQNEFQAASTSMKKRDRKLSSAASDIDQIKKPRLQMRNPSSDNDDVESALTEVYRAGAKLKVGDLDSKQSSQYLPAQPDKNEQFKTPMKIPSSDQSHCCSSTVAYQIRSTTLDMSASTNPSSDFKQRITESNRTSATGTLRKRVSLQYPALGDLAHNDDNNEDCLIIKKSNSYFPSAYNFPEYDCDDVKEEKNGVFAGGFDFTQRAAQVVPRKLTMGSSEEEEEDAHASYPKAPAVNECDPFISITDQSCLPQAQVMHRDLMDFNNLHLEDNGCLPFTENPSHSVFNQLDGYNADNNIGVNHLSHFDDDNEFYFPSDSFECHGPPSVGFPMRTRFFSNSNHFENNGEYSNSNPFYQQHHAQVSNAFPGALPCSPYTGSRRIKQWDNVFPYSQHGMPQGEQCQEWQVEGQTPESKFRKFHKLSGTSLHNIIPTAGTNLREQQIPPRQGTPTSSLFELTAAQGRPQPRPSLFSKPQISQPSYLLDECEQRSCTGMITTRQAAAVGGQSMKSQFGSRRRITTQLSFTEACSNRINSSEPVKKNVQDNTMMI